MRCGVEGHDAFDAVAAVGGEQCQDLVAAGVADRSTTRPGWVPTGAVPEGGGLGGVDGIAVAVARHRDPAPVGGGGQFGGDAQPLALEPGAAAFAGARRRGRVDRTALTGSRVVNVVFSTSSTLPW